MANQFVWSAVITSPVAWQFLVATETATGHAFGDLLIEKIGNMLRKKFGVNMKSQSFASSAGPGFYVHATVLIFIFNTMGVSLPTLNFLIL